MAFEYYEFTVENWNTVERLKLNQFGADNWECYEVLEWGAGNLRYFFKREIPVYVPNIRDVLGNNTRELT